MRIEVGVCALLISLASASPSWTGPRGPPAPTSPRSNGKTCTVKAHGNKTDDTPQILAAFTECNNGGTVVFPENENYWIATKLNPVIEDVTVEWKGIWTVGALFLTSVPEVGILAGNAEFGCYLMLTATVQMSDNLAYWRNNSYPIAFQNHHAGFIITGNRIHINGYTTGGIFGNGNAWYNAEQKTTQPGRPMPFVFWNVSDVFVEHFFVKDPPLWSLNIMNGTNMWFDDIYNNATAVNAPWGTNWVQNTDGFDTMDAYNIKLTNMVYQGGDDCIAIKPRSYNIFVQNITCHGGNGIAIGSLGQYLEDSSVINVLVKDANILTYNKDMEDGAYIKTYVGALVPQSGYESAGLPRGGGWGVVQNIRFENFYVEGASIGAAITQGSGDNGSYAGTSKMEISNIAFVNFTGYTEGGKGSRTASVSCSKVHPCYNIAFQNFSMASAENATAYGATGTCSYIAGGGVSGLSGSGC